ncbi:hypothetical protein WDU94_005122 [Cyamophila willieti]
MTSFKESTFFSVLLLMVVVCVRVSSGALSPGQIINPTKVQPVADQNIVDQCAPKVNACDPKSIYRTFDGSCNNLQHPSWGMANTGHVRLLSANYADGKSKYRVSSVDKSELPSPRLLRTLLFKAKPPTDIHTRAFLTFSQIIAHDVTSNPESPGPKCCSPSGSELVQPQPPICRPITIPANDTYYAPFKRTCMEYRASLQLSSCPLNNKVMQPILLNSHYIDGSVIYGSGDKKAKSLRTNQGGKLVVVMKGDTPVLPPFQDLPVATSKSECPLDPTNCYDSGDPRVNQNLDLVAQTLALYRFHNYLADKLAVVKPGASDEELYQTGRKIMGGVLQHITYNDILPALLGKEYVSSVGLAPESGYSKAYSPDTNPATLADLVAAAFRSLHTYIPDKIDFVKEDRTVAKSIPFSESLHNPGPVFTVKNNFDDLLRGQATQLQEKADSFMTEEITNKFFDNDVPDVLNHKFGDDLAARDIQRGRDFGLQPYNDYRELCGFSRAKTFDDFKDNINPETIAILKSVYKSVDDVDFYAGAFSETFLPGTLTTPTFRCVIAEAFSRYKKADRFFYLNADHPGSLTLDQIKTIQSISLAHIFCGGSVGIVSMQPDALHPASPTNKLTPCADLLKQIDLNSFK